MAADALSDALFDQVAASLGGLWGVRLGLSLECPQTLQSVSPTVGRAVSVGYYLHFP